MGVENMVTSEITRRIMWPCRRSRKNRYGRIRVPYVELHTIPNVFFSLILPAAVQIVTSFGSQVLGHRGRNRLSIELKLISTHNFSIKMKRKRNTRLYTRVRARKGKRTHRFPVGLLQNFFRQWRNAACNRVSKYLYQTLQSMNGRWKSGKGGYESVVRFFFPRYLLSGEFPQRRLSFFRHVNAVNEGFS